MPETLQNSRYHVFLSHSSIDTWVARQISIEVINRGAIPFLDEASINVGAPFEQDILAALDRAHELVVLLTPWALDRPYVWAELGAAWGRRIPIVALLHGLNSTQIQSRPEIPVFIKERDFVDLNKVDTYFSKLSDRVALLNGTK
jgi:hypothetical protein